MPAPVAIPPVLPLYGPDAIRAFQFSSWYPRFATHTIKSTVVRPLSSAFRDYLDSDGVFVPDGAEDLSVVHAREYTPLPLMRLPYGSQPGRELLV